MPHTTPRALKRARTQAKLLLKDFHSTDPNRVRSALYRFRSHPDLASMPEAEILAHKDRMQLKHAQCVVAQEWGHDRWMDLVDQIKTAAKTGVPFLSGGMRRFFEVEIRNEEQGGDTPARLGTAEDSIGAPEDVLRSWFARCGMEFGLGVECLPTLNVSDARRELADLVDYFGHQARLADVLDGSARPIGRRAQGKSDSHRGEWLRVRIRFSDSNPDAAAQYLAENHLAHHAEILEIEPDGDVVEADMFDPDYERDWWVPLRLKVQGGKAGLLRILEDEVAGVWDDDPTDYVEFLKDDLKPRRTKTAPARSVIEEMRASALVGIQTHLAERGGHIALDQRHCAFVVTLPPSDMARITTLRSDPKHGLMFSGYRITDLPLRGPKGAPVDQPPSEIPTETLVWLYGTLVDAAAA